MAKFSAIKNTLQNGELSDKLVGRTDLNEYKNGAKLIQNFLPTRFGGAFKRTGLRYKAVSPTGLGDKLPALIPFIDISGGSFLIAPVYYQSAATGAAVVTIYVIDNDGNTLLTQNTVGHSPYDSSINAETGWHYAQIGRLLFLCHRSRKIKPIQVSYNGTVFTATNTAISPPYQTENQNANLVLTASSTTGFTRAFMKTGAGAETQFFKATNRVGFTIADIGVPNYRVANASTTGQFQVFAVIVPLTPPDITPATNLITFTNHYLYDRDEVVFKGPDLPDPLVADTSYFVKRIDANNFKLAATAATVPFGPYIDILDVGTGSFDLWGINTASAEINVEITLPGEVTAAGLISWQQGSWGGERGFPGTCCGFDQRLLFASNLVEIDTIWNSRKGNLLFFTQDKLIQDATTDVSGLNYFGPLASTDAFSYYPAADNINAITWMSSQRNLHIGTFSTEYIADYVNGVYGPPTSFEIRPQTFYGGTGVRAEKQGNTTLFIARSGKQLRDFSYSDNNGSNLSRDLSILADQLFAHGFVSGEYQSLVFTQMCWQESESVLWLLTSLGSLVSMTLDESGQAAGWARHVIGGSDVKVKSICCLPSGSGQSDELWLVVERTVNSTTVQYIEKLTKPFENLLYVNTSTADADLPVYLDSAVYVVQASSTTVPGLSHLEGEEVYCLADGVKQGPFTVSSGAITLTNAAEKIIVGLAYVSKIQTLPIEAGSIIGSAQILLKRVEQVLIKLYKSSGGQLAYGPRKYDLQYKGAVSGEPFTGDIDMPYHSTNAKDYRIDIEHSDPTPFNLLAIVMRGNTED